MLNTLVNHDSIMTLHTALRYLSR